MIGESAERLIIRHGYAIPIYSNATEQLSFALSQFSDLRKRKAALECVIELFPLQRLQVAKAKLELAYLSLGDDFRLATQQDCKDAIAKYEAIAEEYRDLPTICAKARWYIAWIYLDLIQDKRRGLQSYQRVVREYPFEGFLPAPYLPWQEIFAKAAKKDTAFLSKKEYWGAIALLEIIRNVESPKTRLETLKQLITLYPTSRAVPYALMAILNTRNVVKEAVQIVKRYLHSSNCDPFLKEYLTTRFSNSEFRD